MGNSFYSIIAKRDLNGEADAQETIFIALEQSYHFNPHRTWSDSLLDELKAYARLHGKPESIWNSIEEYENYINQLIVEMNAIK